MNTISDVARAAIRSMTYDELGDELLHARLEQQAHERCGRIQSCHQLAESAVNALLDEYNARHAWKGQP